MRRVRRGALVAALTAAALALTGCGGAATDGGGEERVWVRAVNGDPMTTGINAQLITGTIPSLFSAQILDPLIFMSDDYKLSPALAEEWELSDDGLDLEFTLRQGVTWHDGEPFTAEDVKFNFEEIFPLSVYGAPLAERMESLEIVDEDTVVLHLAEPYGPLLETIGTQYMLPKHVFEGTDYITNEANKELIGTGPMMYDSYSPGESVTLVKNPDFWGGEVQVDRAVYTTVADPNSRAVALFAGEIDQAILDPSQQQRVADDPNTELLSLGDFPQVVTMMFNALAPQLTDPAVRAAIYAALDREQIAETGMAGVGVAANGFFPEMIDWAVNEDIDFAEDFPRDLDAINAALDEAGYPRGADGTRFRVRILYIMTLGEVVATVEMAQSMLREVGIETELIGVGGAVYSDTLYTQGDFDIAIVRTSLGPDPSLGIARWYVCNEAKAPGSNPSGVCDPEIDAAAATALSTSDREARGEALRDLQARARELMFHAPIAWFNGAFPTITSVRWEGQDAPREHAERMPWMTMSPVG